MTEETHNAARSGPRGIVMSILVSLIAGWVLLIGITFAIQKSNYVGEATAIVAPGQIWIDSIGRTGAELLLLVAIGAQLFCGMSSITANSRMIYAFSRDGALPGSGVWHQVNKRTRTPTNAIWLAAGGALILGLPYLWNTAAYGAVVSIATIGLYVAYVAPTYLRLRQGDSFKRGPWHLGRWSYVIGWTAVTWVVFIFFLFMLPQFGPITWLTFNYAPIAVAVVIGYAGIYLAGLGETTGSPGPRSRARLRNWPRSSTSCRSDGFGLGDAAARPADPGAAARRGRGGRDRHRRARLHRHAGPAGGQAAVGGVLPGGGGRALFRGLQLPARGGRGHEHGRRVRHVVLGARLRRLRAGA